MDTHDRSFPVPFPLTSDYKLEVTYSQSNGCKVYKEVAPVAVQDAMLKSTKVNTASEIATLRRA
jgi:hypothetical protein